MSKTPSWDERYGTDEYQYGTEPNTFLTEHVARIVPGGRVLSLGEGEGRNGVFLARQGFRVVGIDGSVVGLAKAQRLADAAGVAIELVHGDLTTASFPRDVDAVVSIFCHLPSAVRRVVYARAEAALRSGGVVLTELYRPEQVDLTTGGPKDLDMLATLQDLRREFAACDLEFGREIERDVHEGRLHTGVAAVVQAVFRKR